MFDAWEAKYGGDHRAAAIDRLERLCVEKIHLKVPVLAGSTTAGNAIQKNVKNCRAKPGPGTHPQPPLFSTIDVSSLKAPTGNSFIGEGFCGHTPPHAAGNLLDCLSTMERTLMDKETKCIEAKTKSKENGDNTKTFVKSGNDNSNCPNGSFTLTTKVKVSQISVKVKPNCVKTGTPPLTNSSRRETKSLSKSAITARKSVSSPEAMSIGGDETTSSEKGSRSPSPFRSLNCESSSTGQPSEKQCNETLLDNDPQSSTNIQNLQQNSSERYPSTQAESSTGCHNDNINGNTFVDHAAIQ